MFAYANPNEIAVARSHYTAPAPALFNEFHALLVMPGKDYCKPRPKCQGCPLDPLPHTIDVDAAIES